MKTVIRVGRLPKLARLACGVLRAGSWFLGGLACFLCLRSQVAQAADDELAKVFTHPPDSARPWVYWFVMDGNLNREGITADFEALKRVGIGGVLFMEVDVGIPKGPVKFMSPPWRELFKHANAEAARLGLVMTMPASPGWTGSGGPWVKPEESMQKLVSSEIQLAGPRRFEGVLPQPETVAGFCRDAAVLAFRTPPEPYRISGIAEKALYHRGHFSSEPGVKALLAPADAYAELKAEQIIPLTGVVNLTDKLDQRGHLSWDVPDGSWTVLRFGHTSTGANTRPAPEPGLGLECDKLDKAALESHFENFLGKLMSDIGPLTGKSLISLHIDSWEMGSQNWTARFPEEFRTRRGYDLMPYLPVMTGRVVQSLEISERFLWDLRQTVLELVTENHATHLADLAHQHGLGLSIEPYDGTPCDDMTYGSRADVPMGEFWRDTFTTWFSCTEASSIAHTYGKRVVQAEAFTSGDGERWLAHPATLKTLGDWAFCEGINRFVFHRYAHQPWLDRWPGMTMGPYGIHYDRTQTWFDLSTAWIQYLSRCQALLQQGWPVADVCFLKPEASPQVFRAPASATRGDPPDRLGYSYDAINPEALLTRVVVRDGRLRLPDGMEYRVLVVPEFPTMTPQLLAKLEQLASAGATIIGPPPRRSPSLSNYPRCDRQVRELAAQLWGACDGVTIKEVRHGAGRVVWERGPEQPNAPAVFGDFGVVCRTLAKMGVPPDFESDGPFRYTHRRTPQDDIYFVANREERWAAADCAFRVIGRTPHVWDPLTGEMAAVAVYRESSGRTTLPLALPPAGSVFVVFRERSEHNRIPPPDPVVGLSRDDTNLLPEAGHPRSEETSAELISGAEGPLNLLAWKVGQYEIRTASGVRTQVQVSLVPPTREITGPWDVRFQARRGAPDAIELPELRDLSTHPDPAVRYFSGTADYQMSFTVSADLIGLDKRIFLDLGRVAVMAEVILNGTNLGVLWKAPFRLDVTAALRPGVNRLHVRVANLWLNRLIGDQSLPPNQRVAWTTWNPFTKDTPLPPSGLLGPVTLQAAVIVPVKTKARP
jgi:hypothetical protein